MLEEDQATFYQLLVRALLTCMPAKDGALLNVSTTTRGRRGGWMDGWVG